MKKYVIFCLLVLSSIVSIADNLSKEKAFQIAQSVIGHEQKVVLTSVIVNDLDTVCFIYEGEDAGYAIISAKNNHIISYDNKAHFNVNNIPSQLMALLQGYSYDEEKSMLKATRLLDHEIAPLLYSSWNQRGPFNQLCPTYNGKICVTGCKSLALAQVMNYYKYPSAIVADIPSYETSTCGISLSKIEKGTEIDWNNILENYDGEYTEEQAVAVSNLVNFAGRALKTDYQPSTSSSEINSALVLSRYFGYDSDCIRRLFRSSYNLTEWMDIMYQELSEGRPILYEGQSMGGGHAFICDGIDKNGLFHINWGWGGDYDGYYDITFLAPDCNDGIGASTTEDGYAQDNCMIIGIQPDNGKTEIIENETYVSAVKVKYQTNSSGSHYLFFTYATTFPDTVTVNLAAGYIASNGDVVCLRNYGVSVVAPDKKYSQTTAYPLNVSSLNANNVYQICLLESLDGGKSWRTCNGYENVYVTLYGNGSSFSAQSADYDLDAQLIVPKYEDGIATVKVRFTNEGNNDYYDVFYFIANSTNVNPMLYSYASGITVESKNYNDIEFSYVPKSDTVYYWIMDKSLTEISSGKFHKGQIFEDFPTIEQDDVVEDDKQDDDSLYTAISEIEENIEWNISGNNLTISAKETKEVVISTISGQIYLRKILPQGSSFSLFLPSGLYVIDGKALVVSQ